jgi:peptidoglycan hydrolase-like protein with peptidoglycan-binding domain
MSNEKLAEQLGKLKEACAKWEKELSVYSKWAIDNDGVLSLVENQVIIGIKSEIQAIKDHIAKIEKAKGTEPKNKLGITEVEVKDKLANFFAAFDKLSVVVDNVKVEVETPYFMNNGGGGRLVQVGKGSPKDVQKWLQDKINSGAIKSKNPQVLQDFMKQNRIGVDCSGFVSQALNHLADKEGDMDFGSDDIFNPGGRNSTSFGPAGKEFVKISPQNVQIGDTLYYDNPENGGINHIRIVGDIRKENNILYYTLFESAGRVGPRKMEWKFDGKLQEFRGNQWVAKSNETFYRWKSLEMQAPSGGNAGQGQQQDQQQSETGTVNQTNTSSAISASVGKNAVNKSEDVSVIQNLLNKKGATLKVDGDCGPKTIAAIEKFQKDVLKFSVPDGKVDVGGKTWQKLTDAALSQNQNNQGQGSNNNNNQNNQSNSSSINNEELKFSGNIKKAVGKEKLNEQRDVYIVQSLLKKRGYVLPVDGIFESKTEQAIGEFQKSIGGVVDFVISPKGPTMVQLLLKNLPPMGITGDVKTASTTVASDPNQANIKQDVVIAAANGLSLSSPVLVIIGGMHGWTGSKMLKHTPSALFAKAVIIAAGYTASWKDIESAYQAHFKTTTALNMGSCSAVGFSAGGSPLFRWGFTKFKTCGLADPYITTERAKTLGSNCILSCNFVDWSADRITPEGIMKAALEKGAFAEETRIPHGDYPAYFLSQFGGKLV